MNLVYPIKYVSSISDMICIQYIQYSENGMGKRESWLWRRTNVRISHNNGQKKTRWPCDDHGDDHDDDITMFCSVVCPCSSSSMPVVYICKTPFSLYTLATSTTLFVSLFVCCFVCCRVTCIDHVGMIWSEYCDHAAWDEWTLINIMVHHGYRSSSCDQMCHRCTLVFLGGLCPRGQWGQNHTPLRPTISHTVCRRNIMRTTLDLTPILIHMAANHNDKDNLNI